MLNLIVSIESWITFVFFIAIEALPLYIIGFISNDMVRVAIVEGICRLDFNLLFSI